MWKAVSSLFGFNYLAAIDHNVAVIIVAYCTLGGFLAASMTDLIQSIVMTIALIVVDFVWYKCSWWSRCSYR